MLKELINFAYHNQNKAIYYNTSLSENHKENNFWYNMLVLENGEVWNSDTIRNYFLTKKRRTKT